MSQEDYTCHRVHRGPLRCLKGPRYAIQGDHDEHVVARAEAAFKARMDALPRKEDGQLNFSVMTREQKLLFVSRMWPAADIDFREYSV